MDNYRNFDSSSKQRYMYDLKTFLPPWYNLEISKQTLYYICIMHNRLLQHDKSDIKQLKKEKEIRMSVLFDNT